MRVTRCGCGVAAPLAGLRRASAVGGRSCAGCGEWMAVRPAGSLAREVMPEALFELTLSGYVFLIGARDSAWSARRRASRVAMAIRARRPAATRRALAQALREAADEAPSEALLGHLAQRPEWCARAAVAACSEAPDALLEILAMDPDRRVQLVLLSRRDLSRRIFALMADSWDARIRVAVAGSPATPDALRAHLAQDCDARVREAATRPTLRLIQGG